MQDLAKMMEKGSKSRWGNSIGYVLFPLWIRLEEDTLEYIRRAKITMDRKKLSLEPIFSFALLKLTMKVFGLKVRQNKISHINYMDYITDGRIWMSRYGKSGTEESC